MSEIKDMLQRNIGTKWFEKERPDNLYDFDFKMIF